MTLKEAAKLYLERQKSLISPHEHERQESILDKHLKPFLAGKLRNITKRRIEEYITFRSRKCSPATVRKEVGVLKHLLNWATEGGLVPVNVAARISMPKPPAGRVRYLQPTELKAILDHCPPWIKPIVLLAVSTGMRRGEILALRWMDVDLMNRQINLPQTKNGKGRIVFLNSNALDVFRSLPLDKETVANEPVFAVDVTPEELSMCFIRACRSAGVPDFHFHDLRHTHATWLRQSGVQLDEIARQLGHSDLRMTQRYAHLSESQAREAISRLDSILRPLKGPEVKTEITEAALTRLQ
jgi:integrase